MPHRNQKAVGLIGVLLIMLVVPNIKAQEYATIHATATVIPALVVIGENDLIFGTVFPGVDKTVDKATVGFAGEFSIQGNNLAEITIDFTLPDSLMHEDSLSYMRISFTDIDASFEDGTGGGQSAPAGIINPLGPSTENLGAAGQMTIWIGGMVEPGITQTGGDYIGDITLTVAYTGS
ncbi:MAG: hypothetical protein JSV44_11800 [Candidatus Zixiibacteriota bacterium]|nr:MAG: hypothetical protein JSV44_11800 [candidate division Zixibacteria bacterium]